MLAFLIGKVQETRHRVDGKVVAHFYTCSYRITFLSK